MESEYSTLVQSGFISTSYGMCFFPRVVEDYGQTYNRILDAGCGQCSVVSYLTQLHRDAYGVELSTASLEHKDCPPLMATGRVKQSSLTNIPFVDDYFDLVFSSEVLEHIPEFDIPAVIKELVRVSKGDLFLSISLRRAGADPPPPAPATVHVTVKSRQWWNMMFNNVSGCVVNQIALDSVLAGRDVNREPWMFSFRCKDRAAWQTSPKKLTIDKIWSENTRISKLVRPDMIQRRFQGTPYWPYDVGAYDNSSSA